MLQKKYIISPVIKLNDYYMRKKKKEKKFLLLQLY